MVRTKSDQKRREIIRVAAETFQEATCRSLVNVKMACDEVIQMKKRKITVPCDSSNGMRSTPCVSRRINRGIRSVVTDPVIHVRRDKPSSSV